MVFTGIFMIFIGIVDFIVRGISAIVFFLVTQSSAYAEQGTASDLPEKGDYVE
ncbi:hypothetical protein HNR44_002993 [Geomicrobium halophilum]|uniref:Uncharacterized protein n=1 Tax=Geomicrobium halophilum TaxID=549000 RepID=A0A841Q0A2_9BACL|nr:hypothetical protein [Geomicrobium halophilum]MBB6451003.1 hypothetical protein [Geomicrobium halophilum]